MEIITYVISGTLEHADSLGSKGQIRAGEIQRMSAGSGIQHSEYNPGDKEPCHLLQIWLFPNVKGVAPSWEQVEWKSRPVSENGMRLLVSPDGRGGSARIHQEALLWHAHLKAGASADLEIGAARGGWLQMIRGKISLKDGTQLLQGDGLAVEGAEQILVTATDESEYIWFDLN